jgi:hypothetical protein
MTGKWWLSALGVASLALGGCIGAAGVPGGPLQGTGATLGLSYGVALAPASVALRTATGARSSYWDNAGDAQNFPIVPSRVGTRFGIGKWFDVAGDVSWLDSGFELRAGLPEGAQPLPMALSLGVRSGSMGLVQAGNRGSFEQRLRLELYPSLWRNDRGLRLNLIATAGVSRGRRYHPLQVPSRYTNQIEVQGPDPDPRVDLSVQRDEVRAEASAGVELRDGELFLSGVLMPYVVTGAGAATGSCRTCDGYRFDGLRQPFGVALFISLGVTFSFHRAAPEGRGSRLDASAARR